MFNEIYIIEKLEINAVTFESMLSIVKKDEYLWKPTAEKWCMLEVICHLYDEEREDFRARLKHVLETPEVPMPKIDPPAWVIERRYMEQEFDVRLNAFLAERERSIVWLRGLQDPKWTNAYQHPTVGPVSADLLL